MVRARGAKAKRTNNSKRKRDDEADDFPIEIGSDPYKQFLSLLGAGEKGNDEEVQEDAEADEAFARRQERDQEAAEAAEEHDEGDEEGGEEKVQPAAGKEEGEEEGPLKKLLGKKKKKRIKSSNKGTRNEVTLSPAGKHDEVLEDEDANMDEENENGARNKIRDMFREHFFVRDPATQPSQQGASEEDIGPVAGTKNASWRSEGGEVQFRSLQESPQIVTPRLAESARRCAGAGAPDEPECQAQMRAVLASYRDVLYEGREGHMGSEKDEIQDAYLVHALSHVMRWHRIVKDNQNKVKSDSLDEAPRDQGFTRPRVLLLFPMRNMAMRCVKRMAELMPAVGGGEGTRVDNWERFASEYGEEHDPEWEKRMAKKPEDYRAIFSGNTDDHFRLGIEVGRTRLRLYSGLYSSDIIVASPLGLATKVQEGEKEGAGDFLSSIEMAIVDHADVLLMQNFDHVTNLFASWLNSPPKKPRGTDVTRIRTEFLDSTQHRVRQSVLLSSFSFPELNAILARHCDNVDGRLRTWFSHEGAMARARTRASQQFERFKCSAVERAHEDRFKHFTKSVWPRVKGKAGVLIFVSSYLEFCRLRKFFREQGTTFCANSEYADGSSVARARSLFADGRYPVMLYSERAHFFRRHQIRGITHLVFYSLPERPSFYRELINLVDVPPTPSPAPSVLAAFCRLDALRLERIVGSSRAPSMLDTKSSGTFLFLP